MSASAATQTLDPQFVTLVLGIVAVGGTLAGTLGGAFLESKLSGGRWKNEFFLQRKIDAVNEFLVALMASNRAAKQRILFTNRFSVKDVDDKAEATVIKFYQASIYFDDADYKTMETAWMKQKEFIAKWMYGIQVEIPKDEKGLDDAYKAAYDRLRTVLTTI